MREGPFVLQENIPACIHTVHHSAGKERGRDSESGERQKDKAKRQGVWQHHNIFIQRINVFRSRRLFSWYPKTIKKSKYTPCVKETQFINAQWENYLINRFERSDSVAAVSRFTCTRSDTSSEVNPAKKNPGRICCMCCISYDVQWLEREESQYDMKLLSALFHIHDEALVEKIIK